jgi:ABC-type Fe3+/spermidine/putrescine transport system ATPase subunit
MLEVANLSKQFLTESDAVRALDGVSFEATEGTLVTLLGASGCGKSTTLRCIAGLEHPEKGAISIAGRVVFSAEPRRFVPAEQRPIGMVFQSYAIWPHMTVFENVAYPLQGRGIAKSQITEEATRALQMVGLGGLAERPSPQLSGGQQQRVALARALVARPKLMLLDEPLSNLDAKLRQHMRIEIRHLQKRTGVTAVYVTHDQEEAMAVSDEIIFLSNGHIVEKGTPEEIYSRPKHRLTAEFFGDANFLAGRIKGREQHVLIVETPGGVIACAAKGAQPQGEQVTVFFRPEDVQVSREKPAQSFALSGVIAETVFLGKTVECSVEVRDGSQLKISVHPRFLPRKGEPVHLGIDPEICLIVNE